MKYLLTILITIIYSSALGQGFELSGDFTTNSNNDFKNTPGYKVGYNFNSKTSNRLSIMFLHSIKTANYDDIKIDVSTNGPLLPEYYFDRIQSNNQKISLEFNYSYRLINNQYSSLLIGSELSLNYFIIEKKTERVYYRPFDSFIKEYSYNSKYYKNNRIGLGLVLEFEIKSVIFNHLNIFSRLNPEIINYGRFVQLDGGWCDPWITGWININLGIRYNLNKKEMPTGNSKANNN